MDIDKLIKRYLAYWDHADIDGLISMYDNSIHYHDLPSGDVFHYKDIKKYLTNTFAFEIDQQINLQDSVYVEGNSAFIHWRQRFTPTGSDKQVKINGVEFIVFREEKIISIHDFYDYQRTVPDDASDTIEGSHIEKMTKLGLEESQLQLIAEEINSYFDQQAPYLEPELNLTMVSEILGYTRNQISYVINHVLKQTFYELVNSWRIQYVLQQMMNKDLNHTILDMAINAGFNSVSGFYSAFKKHTGMTPAKYKRSQAI
ncbi:MAG: helix-turn-helix domain-containing protein [Gammaproteobacteria bacterium]